MTNERMIYHVGDRTELTPVLSQALEAEVTFGFPGTPFEGDLLVLEVTLDPSRHQGLPGGHVFAACKTWKQRPGVAVVLLVPQGDTFSREIARFCLADAVVEFKGVHLSDPAALKQVSAGRRRGVPETLLSRLDPEDASRSSSALARMLTDPADQGWVARHLAEPETGLFCAPFASFKLDEECKRATRFHQPLSLVLLDLGGEFVLPSQSAARVAALAEVAAVFLDQCRDIDSLARFTASTFLFLLPGTAAVGAEVLARRIITSLQERRIQGLERLDPSVGIASMPSDRIRRAAELLRAAEHGLSVARSGSEGERIRISSE